MMRHGSGILYRLLDRDFFMLQQPTGCIQAVKPTMPRRLRRHMALSNVQHRDAGFELVYIRQEVQIHCD